MNLVNYNIETNNVISKEQLAIVLSTFSARNPYSVHISNIKYEDFNEGFGLNSCIRKVKIDYPSHYRFHVPSEVLLKQYNPRLFGISGKNKSSRNAYLRELKFLKFANENLFIQKDGVRLFPTCYNAGIVSEISPDYVSTTLKELEDKRILIMELLGPNLDKKIYQLRKRRDEFSKGSNSLENVLSQDESEKEDEMLKKKILDFIYDGLNTTYDFHKKLQQSSSINDVLRKNEIGYKTLLRKFINYNQILYSSRHGNTIGSISNKKVKLKEVYTPIIRFVCGHDDRTKNLRGVIHADLHHGNIILGEKEKVRFTDAANIVTAGQTIAFDIAPQLFNPVVIVIRPQDAETILKESYLKEDNSISSLELTLASILAGHYWCYKATTASVLIKKRHPKHYQCFLNAHPNHENEVPQYLAFSDGLLEFLIENKSSFKLNGTFIERIRKLKGMCYEMHGSYIDEGKKLINERNVIV